MSADNNHNPQNNSDDVKLRLPGFILNNIDAIVGEWEEFARTLIPASTHMTSLALRDHIHQILAFVVEDMRSAQTSAEETLKSQGRKISHTTSAAETHAALRLAGGFDISQMTSEYRALRASIIKLWRRANSFMDDDDFIDMTRFNESIDQALIESVACYTKERLLAKNYFSAVLGHDLHDPLHAITLSAELILLSGLNERQQMLTQIISDSSQRMNILIDNLLDVTRARFGAGLPILRAPMDMGFVGHQIIDEIQVVHPTRTIVLTTSDNVSGDWDRARVGQVFSNLIGNAMQYGFKYTPIDVRVVGDAESVILTVHNHGVPIAAEKISTIFNPLTRARPDENNEPGSRNLGLGLFIAGEVVQAHGGTIQVTSSEGNGTIFTARFPRLWTASHKL